VSQCPYVTRSGRHCNIGIQHWHWPKWAERGDLYGLMMLHSWWPASRDALNRRGRRSA